MTETQQQPAGQSSWAAASQTGRKQPPSSLPLQASGHGRLRGLGHRQLPSLLCQSLGGPQDRSAPHKYQRLTCDSAASHGGRVGAVWLSSSLGRRTAELPALQALAPHNSGKARQHRPSLEGHLQHSTQQWEGSRGNCFVLRCCGPSSARGLKGCTHSGSRYLLPQAEERGCKKPGALAPSLWPDPAPAQAQTSHLSHPTP